MNAVIRAGLLHMYRRAKYTQAELSILVRRRGRVASNMISYLVPSIQVSLQASLQPVLSGTGCR
jgi:hypothetical protein